MNSKSVSLIAFNDVTLRTCTQQYMGEMIDERRQLMKDGEDFKDLFSRLIAASDNERDPQRALSRREMLGEMFLLLLAGHETSAHATSESLILLALHPDKQEKVFEEAMRVLPDGASDYDQVVNELVSVVLLTLSRAQ